MTLADRPKRPPTNRQRKRDHRGPKPPRDDRPLHAEGDPAEARQRKLLDRAAALAAHTEALKAAIRAQSPSEPWVEEQVVTEEGVDGEGDQDTRRWRNYDAFPPGGRETRMVRCAYCGVSHPPTIGGGANCHEHAVERVMAVRESELLAQHGPKRGKVEAGRLRARLERVARNIDNAFGGSPSATAIRELQFRNLRIKERKLEPEDNRALGAEIGRISRRGTRKV